MPYTGKKGGIKNGRVDRIFKTICSLIIFFGLMYLLIVRPQTKQQQKRKEMLDNLKVGDKIRTIGGFSVPSKELRKMISR